MNDIRYFTEQLYTNILHYSLPHFCKNELALILTTPRLEDGRLLTSNLGVDGDSGLGCPLPRKFLRLP